MGIVARRASRIFCGHSSAAVKGYLFERVEFGRRGKDRAVTKESGTLVPGPSAPLANLTKHHPTETPPQPQAPRTGSRQIPRHDRQVRPHRRYAHPGKCRAVPGSLACRRRAQFRTVPQPPPTRARCKKARPRTPEVSPLPHPCLRQALPAEYDGNSFKDETVATRQAAGRASIPSAAPSVPRKRLRA